MNNTKLREVFTFMKIYYNTNLNKDERMEVFKKYSSHPQALWSKYKYTKYTSKVKFDCSSIVSQMIQNNDHKDVRLEVVSKGRFCDPRVLFLSVETFELHDITVKSEIEDMGGKVIYESSSNDNLTVFLVEFTDFYHCSQALGKLKKNNYCHTIKFAKLMLHDSWKVDEINNFGNHFYKPEGTKIRKKFPINQSFFIRIEKDKQIENIIETVFKNMEGSLEVKKFPFKCDSKNTYFKITCNSAEKAKNALTLFNSLPYGKVSKPSEDYFRPVVQQVPFLRNSFMENNLTNIDKKRSAEIDCFENEGKKFKLKTEEIDMTTFSLEHRITQIFGY
ncbi:hypothetical protein ACFFRR_010653 [Megaselia abdita]